MHEVDVNRSEQQYNLAKALYKHACAQRCPAKEILNAHARDMYSLLQLSWHILFNDNAIRDFREYLMWDIRDLCKLIDGSEDKP